MNALGAKLSAVGLIFARILKVCNKLIYTHLLIFMVKNSPCKAYIKDKTPCQGSN